MFLNISIGDLDIVTVIIIAVVALVVISLIALFINKGKYMARYKNFYKKMDKTITKRFNGNLLNEDILNKYAIDRTNTYKSLKSKGRRAVSRYFDYYVKNLPTLVLYRSFISSDKNKNELQILLLDEYNRVIFKWDKRKKSKGLIKFANKYQMLMPLVAYLYELPLHLYENAEFRFTNHDNGYTITFDIVKNLKKTKRKQKPVKMSKAQQKAQERIEKTMEKKNRKLHRV